jgi:hypothetical protein
MTDKERRAAMWITIGTGAAYALAQVLAAGNARRNSKAYRVNSKVYAENSKRKYRY